jgi:hypothetical protein
LPQLLLVHVAVQALLLAGLHQQAKDHRAEAACDGHRDSVASNATEQRMKGSAHISKNPVPNARFDARFDNAEDFPGVRQVTKWPAGSTRPMQL